jgi:protein-S-isoprenylcysteine O-methyltransferase Ste14
MCIMNANPERIAKASLWLAITAVFIPILLPLAMAYSSIVLWKLRMSSVPTRGTLSATLGAAISWAAATTYVLVIVILYER